MDLRDFSNLSEVGMKLSICNTLLEKNIFLQSKIKQIVVNVSEMSNEKIFTFARAVNPSFNWEPHVENILEIISWDKLLQIILISGKLCSAHKEKDFDSYLTWLEQFLMVFKTWHLLNLQISS